MDHFYDNQDYVATVGGLLAFLGMIYNILIYLFSYYKVMVSLEDFQIEIHQEEDGSYYAEVKNLPGCFTMGETLEDLNVNLKEAILSYIVSLQKDIKDYKFNLNKSNLTYA